MRDLLKLLAARVRMAGHVVTGLRDGGGLKFMVVSAFGAGLIAVLFQSIVVAFRSMRGYPVFQEVLTGYLFSTYFMTMLLMLTFSNAVISFGALYRSAETRMLMSMPVESRTIWAYKSSESLLFSSWAFMVLGGPLLVAYGLHGSLEPAAWTFYPAAAAMMVPFIFIPASLGSLACLLLTRFFPRRPGRALGLFLALAATVCLAVTGFMALRAGILEPSRRVDEEFLEDLLGVFAFTQKFWMPSYWISDGILASSSRNWQEAALHWGTLVACAVFLWSLASYLSEKLYAAGYSRSSGAPTRRFYRPGGLLDRAGGLLGRFAPVTGRLLVKDLRSFVRDPVQWSQILVFFGILFIYAANLRNLGYQKIAVQEIHNLRWVNFVAFANLAAAGLTLATLTTRFVFPMISMEGRRFWILALLPVRRSRLLLGKYVFSLCGSLLLIVPLVLLGARMLGTPPRLAWIQILTALGMCLGLPGIAVGLGAAFPDYRENSPAKIVSGFGGTLCLIVSIAFVSLLVIGVGTLCHHYTTDAPGTGGGRLLQAVALMVAASIAAAVIPMFVGCRTINRAEF